ncbi:hypothetical protein QVD17_37996 [Tagetes erecta]|uniref:Uncharacterized protein n=1 Tax=Tagetes erecta TaxID=13708 RepID=A0AAD8JZE1_TARER|nr:hypothetical protein QVD17_37996 [Tagetes erecta]
MTKHQNHNGNAKLKELYIIVMLVTFVVLSFAIVTYLIVGSYMLNGAQLELHNPKIHNISFDPSNHLFQVATRLQLGFTVPDGIKVYPGLGKFVLTAQLNHSDTLRAVCESTFEVSSLEELISLNFKMNILQKQLDDINKKLHVWVRIVGDLPFAIKLTRLRGLPRSHRHFYVQCDASFHDLKPEYKNCVTSREPFI